MNILGFVSFLARIKRFRSHTGNTHKARGFYTNTDTEELHKMEKIREIPAYHGYGARRDGTVWSRWERERKKRENAQAESRRAAEA